MAQTSDKDPRKVLNGQIAGLRSAAFRDNDAAMARARAAQRQKLIDKIAEVTGIQDQADLNRRADMLERAKLLEMSANAARARRLRAQADAIEHAIADDTTSLALGIDA